MSLREKYLKEQESRAARQESSSPLKLLSGEGKTRMVLVIRDKDGNPKFEDTFPEELKQELLKKLAEG